MKWSNLILACVPAAALVLLSGARAFASQTAPTDERPAQAGAQRRSELDARFVALEAEFTASAARHQGLVQQVREGALAKVDLPPSPALAFYDRFDALAREDQPQAMRWCIQWSEASGLDPALAAEKKNRLYAALIEQHANETWTAEVLRDIRGDGLRELGVERAAALLARAELRCDALELRLKAQCYQAELWASGKVDGGREKALVLYRKLIAEHPESESARRAQGGLFKLEHLQLGMLAPNFTTVDVDGVEFKLSDYRGDPAPIGTGASEAASPNGARGKVVVLDFWGTWCAPCRAMIPSTRSLVERYKDEPFAVIGIDTDSDKDAYKKLAAELGVTWRNSWQGGKDGPLIKQWGITSFPSIYVLDTRGVIRFIGARGAELERAVATLINEAKHGVPPAELSQSGAAPTKDAGQAADGAQRSSAGGSASAQKREPVVGLALGQRAPEFSALDSRGVPFKLSDYRGKVVVLDFWGFWCPSCRALIGHEKELVARLADQPFALIGIDTDKDLDMFRGQLATFGVTWRNAFDGSTGGPLCTAYQIRRFPTIFVLDAEGVIRFMDVTGDALDRAVDQLLARAKALGSNQ